MDYPVLFCEKGSIYNSLNAIVYDIDRNALLCTYELPAVYHPPCRTWSRMRKFSKFYPGEHWLAVWAVLRIRKFGGVLEHPIGSYLWRFMCLPLPGEGVDNFGGFSVKVYQSQFGHKCEKSTLLYICGLQLSEFPAMPMLCNMVSHRISSSKVNAYLKELPKKERSSTPLSFAVFLLSICQLIHAKNKNTNEKENLFVLAKR